MNAGSVFVRVGAQFDSKGFDDFEREHVRAQRLKDISTRLDGDFDPRDFNLYEQKLKETQQRVARRDAFKATLGGDYNPAAFRAYERDLKRAERETRQSTERMRKAAAYGFGFLSATGVYGAVSAIKSVTAAYGESEVSQRKMQAQLKASGESWRKHGDEIDRVIQKTSKMAGLDDEDLQDAFTNIVRVTKDVDKSLRLVGLAADFARAKNLDVAKAGEIVGKVAGGNIGVLGRYGIKIKEGATATEALGELQKRFSGQAEAYGKTQKGAADRASVAWENLREKIGEKLAPTFEKVANRAADFINEMEDGTGQGGRFVDKLEQIGQWLKRVGDRVKGTVEWLVEHKDLVKAAAAAWVSYRLALLAAAGVAKVNAATFLLPGRNAGTTPPVPGGPVAGPAGTPKTGRLRTAGRLGGGVTAGVLASQIAGQTSGNSKDAALTGGLAGASAGSFFGAPGAAVGAATGTVLGTFAAEGKQRKAMLEDERKSYEHLAKAIGVTRKETLGLHDASFGFKTENRKALESMDTRKLSAFRTGIAKLRVTSDESRQELQKLGQAADTELGRRMQNVLRETGKSWEDFGRKPKTTIHDVRVEVGKNAKKIAADLDTRSHEGRKALSDNFKKAADAVARQMDRAGKDTKEGLREIERLTKKSLAVWGLTPGQVKNYMRDDGLGSGNESSVQGRAGGGWIGQRGQVGGDTVPAMLGVGEAVLNRHQQAVVEGLLGEGFLDSLFANVQRPHYLAKGGIVPVPGFPGEQANASVLPMIAAVSKRFGLTLTDAYGQGHKSPGHTKTGTAADFAGPDRAMDAAVRWLVGKGYLVGYDGRFGSQNWPGHGPTSVAGGNAHLHVEFGSSSGAGAMTLADIVAPKTGLRGTLGQAVQAALMVGAGGANKLLSSAISVPVAGGTGTGTAASESQARRWIAAGLRLAGVPATRENIGIVLGRARQESGLDPHAQNNWDSNAKAGTPSKGFLQTIDSTFQSYKVKGHNNIWNPVDNTAAAVRYMMARYGRLVGASSTGYAKGGKVRVAPIASGPKNRTFGKSPTGYRIAPLKKLQAGRNTEYDQLTTQVEDLESLYSVRDRQYNLTDEEIVAEDGTIDQAALQRRTAELGVLLWIRREIMVRYKRMRVLARRLQTTYKTILGRLRGALGHAGKKDRSGYKTQIKDYEDALSDVGGNLRQLDTVQIPNSNLDVLELQKEIGALGVSDTGSSSASDALSDVAGSADANLQAQLDRSNQLLSLATENARGNARILSTFTGTGDIGMGGVNAFRAAAGPSVVINQNMLHPGTPGVQQAVANAAFAGASYQAGIGSPRLSVG